jgi:hypothetical protein
MQPGRAEAVSGPNPTPDAPGEQVTTVEVYFCTPLEASPGPSYS